MKGDALTRVGANAACKKKSSLELTIPLFIRLKIMLANMRCTLRMVGLWICEAFSPSQSEVLSPVN